MASGRHPDVGGVTPDYSQFLNPYGGGPVGAPQGRLPGIFTPRQMVRNNYGKVGKDLSTDEIDQLQAEKGGRAQRADSLQNAGDQALLDPRGSANLFGDIFAQEAKGITDPALRDFQQNLAGTIGNTAARFGGNASSEETRATRNISDDFSRNLTETLGRLAPQQAQMGLDYAQGLANQGNQARGQQDTQEQQILQAIQGVPMVKQKKTSLLGTAIGTAAGIAGKSIL